jgi:hypothetical protein
LYFHLCMWMMLHNEINRSTFLHVSPAYFTCINLILSIELKCKPGNGMHNIDYTGAISLSGAADHAFLPSYYYTSPTYSIHIFPSTKKILGISICYRRSLFFLHSLKIRCQWAVNFIIFWTLP